MSRLVVLLSLFGVLVAGMTENVTSSSGKWTVTAHKDTGKKSGENALINAPEVDLSSEKKKLTSEICSFAGGPSTSAATEETTPKASLEGKIATTKSPPITKLPLTPESVEALPHNKVKETVKADKEEKVSPTTTIKTTEEKDIVKDADTNKIKNETLIHIEAKTEQTPSNGTVTKTVERKVMKGENGKDTGKGTVSEKTTTTDKAPSDVTVSKTVEHKVVKGDEMDEEIDKECEEPVIGEEEEKVGLVIPANTTIKKTIVEHKIVKEKAREGDIPITVVETEKETKTEPAKVDIATESKIDETVLDKEDGPAEIVVTEKKLEKFPGNETKEVVVEEKAEKLSSSDIVKKTKVEEKIVKETSKDGEEPKKDIIIKKEIVEKAINKTEGTEELIC